MHRDALTRYIAAEVHSEIPATVLATYQDSTSFGTLHSACDSTNSPKVTNGVARKSFYFLPDLFDVRMFFRHVEPPLKVHCV
jgi:hypothetical protein